MIKKFSCLIAESSEDSRNFMVNL